MEYNRGSEPSKNDFFMAAISGNTEMVENLIKSGVDIDAVGDTFGMTALIFAIKYRHTKTVQKLIELGADVNKPNNFKVTPLMFASHYGLAGIVDILLLYGANVYAENQKGETALWDAYYSPYIERNRIFDMLFNMGANVNHQDNNGDTLLMIASREGNNEYVLMLFGRKASYLLINNEGKTATDIAFDNRRYKTQRLLQQLIQRRERMKNPKE